MLILTFSSIIKGLIAMIPLVSTILVNYGIMGLMGISLDLGTSVVSCIVIGIGVDYSIHYLSHFHENIKPLTHYISMGINPLVA